MLDYNLRFAKFMYATVLSDTPTRAARHMRDIFNAHDVDVRLCQRISVAIEGEDNECERVATGGATFQFIKPNDLLAGSKEFFEKWGSQVYSYCFAVNDVDAAVEAMEKAGAKVLVHRTGADRLPYKKFFDVEGEPLEYALIDVVEQCGMRFEFIKKNPIDEPCHTGTRYETDRGPFQHFEIVVPDAEAAGKFMYDNMAAEEVEQLISDNIYTHCDPNGCGTYHALFGGVTFQLIEPGAQLTGWGDQLATMGPSTRDVCFHIRGDIQLLCNEVFRRGGFAIIEPGYEQDPDPETGLTVLGQGEWDGLCGEDQDDPKRGFKIAWIDDHERCGMVWEFLSQLYRWPTLTGYFFSRDQD